MAFLVRNGMNEAPVIDDTGRPMGVITLANCRLLDQGALDKRLEVDLYQASLRADDEDGDPYPSRSGAVVVRFNSVLLE